MLVAVINCHPRWRIRIRLMCNICASLLIVVFSIAFVASYWSPWPTHFHPLLKLFSFLVPQQITHCFLLLYLGALLSFLTRGGAFIIHFVLIGHLDGPLTGFKVNVQAIRIVPLRETSCNICFRLFIISPNSSYRMVTRDPTNLPSPTWTCPLPQIDYKLHFNIVKSHSKFNSTSPNCFLTPCHIFWFLKLSLDSRTYRVRLLLNLSSFILWSHHDQPSYFH